MTPAIRSFVAAAAIVAGLLGPSVARAAGIVDTAVAAGSFTTLVTAVKAAGLVNTLKGKGRTPCSRPMMQPSPSCRPERSNPC